MYRTQRASIGIAASVCMLVCGSVIGGALFRLAAALTLMPPAELGAQPLEGPAAVDEDLLMSAHVQGAAAARKLALFVPGLRSSAGWPQACADGGTVSSTSTASRTMSYVFTDCSKDGYKFSGVAHVFFVGAGSSFTVDHQDLRVEGPAGLNMSIEGHTACVVANAALLPRCVTRYEGYHWSEDAFGKTAGAGLVAAANSVAALGSY
jgi:hypothetical protein